jgi:hypothetical protein
MSHATDGAVQVHPNAHACCCMREYNGQSNYWLGRLCDGASNQGHI